MLLKVPPAFDKAVTPKVLEQNKHKPWLRYTEVTTNLLGGPVSENRELAAAANPITYIDRSDPPFLIFHGELDDLVPISQSEILFEALKTQGVKVTFLRDRDRGHSQSGENGEKFSPKLIEMTINFFDIYLKSK